MPDNEVGGINIPGRYMNSRFCIGDRLTKRLIGGKDRLTEVSGLDLTALKAGLRINNNGTGNNAIVAFFRCTVIDDVNIIVTAPCRAGYSGANA